MRRGLWAALLMGALSVVATAGRAQRIRSNAGAITAEQMRDYLTFVASDEMEGRNTPSHGLDTTALFLSTLLKRWGAKPMGGDGSFYQHVTLERSTVDAAQTSLQVGEQKFTFGEDYVSGSLEHPFVSAVGTVTAPLVYAGSGWMVKSKRFDDFRGIDAKGKIVIVNETSIYVPPQGVTQEDLKGKPGTDWADPVTYARQKGAVGMLILSSPRQNSWNSSRFSNTRGMWSFPKAPSFALDWPVWLVGPKVAAALFQGEQTSVADLTRNPPPAFELQPGKRVTWTLARKIEQAGTQNVVAVFEGSDPVLKNEYVALGAHYDHLGSFPETVGDGIYNGADDDGSGTVALLAMAEALSRAGKRPKRSTLLVWHFGEEEGMVGSDYFTKHPTVPLDKIVTQLNIDMIGRSRSATDMRTREAGTSGTHEIYVVGSRRLSSELGALNEKVNAGYLKLHFNYKFDDPHDPSSMYYRSDHYSYARRGIPIIFYCDGMEGGDYHGPGDEAQKIDYQKMERVARTIYETLWAIANLNHRPTIDKPAEKN